MLLKNEMLRRVQLFRINVTEVHRSSSAKPKGEKGVFLMIVTETFAAYAVDTSKSAEHEHAIDSSTLSGA